MFVDLVGVLSEAFRQKARDYIGVWMRLKIVPVLCKKQTEFDNFMSNKNQNDEALAIKIE